jgi:acyl carrier protein
MHPEDIERETRNFLASNFLVSSSEQLADHDPLLGKVIDSTGVLELIAFLERNFSIRVPDEDVLPENLDSIKNITVYITKRLASDS